MKSILGRLVLLGLLLFTVANLAGWLLNEAAEVPVVIAIVLVIFGLHARSGLAITRWLADFRLENVPMVSGWWGDLASKLFRTLKLHNRQQQALSNALLSFRSAAQALPDGVVNLDASGTIIWCNDTAQRHLNLKLSTDVGHRLINLVRTPDFAKYLANETWDDPITMYSPRMNGTILSVQAVSYGEKQVLVLTRDVTQLEKLESMRRDFIANVSHELKTPLTVLSGFLETMRDLPLSEQQKSDYLELMYNQAGRMQNLVEDLLVLSSLESGSPSDIAEEVNLSALTQRIHQQSESLSAGNHQVILTHNEPDIWISGAELEIESALTNIATNAVRYTPDGGKVKIALELVLGANNQPFVEFSVQDNGIGIAPEHIPRLTERFYRVDRSRSRESGGTGLGLAIVKHVVSRHQGDLYIDSVPGQGSRFAIRLPLDEKYLSRIQKPAPIGKSKVAANQLL